MEVVLPAKVRAVVHALLDSPGETPTSLRSAVMARAAALTGEPAPTPGAEVPEPLAAYVEKVALHAYRVTDDDIEALRRAGYTEDAILEVTLGAALGAGLARLRLGLAALRGAR